MMLPYKFLKNNCIENRLTSTGFYTTLTPGTLKQLEDWKKSDPEVCIILLINTPIRNFITLLIMYLLSYTSILQFHI